MMRLLCHSSNRREMPAKVKSFGRVFPVGLNTGLFSQ